MLWLSIGIIILWAISCGPHTATLAQPSGRFSAQLLIDALLHATEAQVTLVAILFVIGLSWSFHRQRVLAAGLVAVRQPPPPAVSALVPDIIPRRRLYLLVDDRPYSACIGLWRPAIYVTQGLVANASPEALRAALAHEEAHRRRHDPLRLFLFRSLARILSMAPMFATLSERAELRAEVTADRFACGVTSRPALAQAILLTIRGEAPATTSTSTTSTSAPASTEGQLAHQTPGPAHLVGLHQTVNSERFSYLMAVDERPLPNLLTISSDQCERQRRQSQWTRLTRPQLGFHMALRSFCPFSSALV